MRFLSTLLTILAFSSTVFGFPGQGGQNPPGAMDTPEIEVDEDDVIKDEEINRQLVAEAEAYLPVWMQFRNAAEGYRFEIRELRAAGVSREEFPPSPVHEYLPIFSTMAENGNGAAAFWLIEQATNFFEDDAALADYLRGYYTDLAQNHASADYIDGAMTRLMKSRRLLGEQFAIDVLQTLQKNTHRRRTLTMGMHFEAKVLVSGENAADPERRARAEELWRILIDGYPKSKASKYAGSPLLTAMLRDFQDAKMRWVRRARQIVADGGSEDTWGTLPGREFEPLIIAIGSAGHPAARRWTEKFFPGMDQATRTSIVHGLAYDIKWMGKAFGASNKPWVELRFEMAELVFEAQPNSDVTYEVLTGLAKQALSANYEGLTRVFSTILARTTDPRIAAEANLAMAQVLMRGKTVAELDRATELFKVVAETAPDPRQRDEAREKGLEFSWTMPGAVHPTLNLTDTDQQSLSTLSYRGQVLYLYFWSQDVPGCKEEIPFVNDLASRYAGTEFSILGLNVEMMDLAGFRRTSRDLGITWRNVLLQERNSWVASTLAVRTFPHAIIIDDEGIIRGRGLDNKQTHELIDQLLLEQTPQNEEGGSPDVGRVRGLARYGGSEPALPPLQLTETQISVCSRRGSAMDLADRSRLVSETGGLANVVLTVQVPNRIGSGVGSKLSVQRYGCRYEPHVLVAEQGARLEVQNGDVTAFGAGARSLHNSSFNVVLNPGRSYSTEVNAKDRFQLSSDTSPWMSSWVVVTDTPFYCVSDANGEFAIPNLPPGKYTADWWHESLGTGQSAEFEITAGGTALIELVVGAQ